MRQHLLIDADDTLWENNIYFEQAIHEFIDFLNHSNMSHEEVRLVLDETERMMGYGATNFTNSLLATYQQLAENTVSNEQLQYVRQLGEQIHSHPLTLLDGVLETLEYLAPRHDLVLLTKGDLEEQRLKVDRSGIEQLFNHVLIVPEKNVATYQQIVDQLELQTQISWMIGNSPRSDINPALAAGLNAVFVPHPQTWVLEHEEVTQPATNNQLLTLERFADLRVHF
ncbi:HAD hydrolase-like protein [Dictyobacter aurantiacus]|uniref:Haloacid dehalogenase n=1 Tax=Dictyobacter aurantiacus TaxID=1936993 RepID=A0A401ZGZ1_9CHLR|nr:HAD hydrolase-like protein [Dictyobacter aurantiacus]GCE06106.1 haloacid dehalogenase [Dictyobacter aurantiacus]